MKLRVSVLPLLAGLSACGETPTVLPVRNLERPSDMTFVCMERVGDQLTGRPMTSCHPRGVPQPATTEAGLRVRGTFALVSNTARGELAAIDVDRGRIVDLEAATPGFGLVPLGQFPEAIVASTDGCRALTANRGSCNLSVLDTSQLLAGSFGAASASSVGSPSAVTFAWPKDASGAVIASRPHEIAFLPEALPPPGAAPLCSAEKKHRALVSYPSCSAVALVELPTGLLVQAIQVGANGAVKVTSNVRELACPVECSGRLPVEPPAAADSGSASDASVEDASLTSGPSISTDSGAEDATGVSSSDSAVTGGGEDASGVGGVAVDPPPVASRPTGAIRLGPLAVVPDGSRAFVGGLDSEHLLTLDIVGGSELRDAGWIPLHEGPGGVTRLRLTIDPYQPPPTITAADQPAAPRYLGAFVGSTPFVYAFALDGSVRVVKIAGGATGLDRRECNVSLDRTRSGMLPPDQLACPEMPVDRTAARRSRLPGARGPGLRLPSILSPPNVAPPLPRDVAFAQIDKQNPNPAPTWLDVQGAIGYVLSSTGQVLLLNLEATPRAASQNTPLRSQMDPAYPHTFRNDAFRATGASAGEVGVASGPTRTYGATDVPYPVRSRPVAIDLGPQLVGPGPTAFAPPHQSIAQAWTITWEDRLASTLRPSGLFEPAESCGAALGSTAAGAAGCLVDVGATFCANEVRSGDILALRGCETDEQCGPGDRRRCLQVVPGAEGFCWPKDRSKAQAEACRELIGSRRRYEIARATQNRLELRLRPEEVALTDPCPTGMTECSPDLGRTGYRCRVVHAGEAERCVKPCENGCGDGFVCDDRSGLCMEAPTPSAACWPEEAWYVVHAGKSFQVTGSETSRAAVTRVGVGGFCEVIPAAERSSLLVDRIPLNAPLCEGLRLPGAGETGYARKVLSETLDRSQDPRAMLPVNPCRLEERGPNNEKVGTLIAFQNEQVGFVLADVEGYRGDGLGFQFTTEGGFRPDVIDPTGDVFVAFGSRIITGPDPNDQSALTPTSFYPHLYVIDQGRTFAGGRGQVLRINPRPVDRGTDRYRSGLFESRTREQSWPVQ